MFNGCSNLTTVELGDLSSVTKGDYMFMGCSSLESIELDTPSMYSAVSICEGCTNLKSAKIKLTKNQYDSVYAKRAFYGCTSLSDVEISEIRTLSDNGIMKEMFYDCNLNAASVERLLNSMNTGWATLDWCDIYLGIKRSAVDKFTEITGLTPTSTTEYQRLVWNKKMYYLYVRITSED
jgi:hypothetical protein